MAESPDSSSSVQPETPGESGPVDPPGGGPFRAWRGAWQFPLLGLGVVLLIAGIVAAFATKPRTDLSGVMDAAESMMGRDQYASAVRLLGEEVWPYVDRQRTTAAESRRYHLLMARGIHRGQRLLAVPDPRNDRSVVREYEAFERLGGVLEASDREALIGTHLALGEIGRAEEHIGMLPPDRAGERRAWLKRVTMASLSLPLPDTERAHRILAEMLTDPALPEDYRIWGVGEQARLSLDRGAPEEAIAQILRATPRLSRPSGEALAGLLTLLGRAYLSLASPEIDEAQAQLVRALELFDPSSAASAEALVVVARLELHRGRLDEARERLLRVAQWFGASEWYLPSLLTMAELESAAGNLDASMEHYAALVAMANDGPLPRWITRAEIWESLTSESESRLSAGDVDRAQRLALLGLDLAGLEEAPASVLRVIADSDLESADRLLPVRRGTSEAVFALSDLDAATRAQVRRHLIRAASYLRQFAERMVVEDREQYGRALWRAADAFDRAGDTEEAIRAFQEYIESFPDEPSRAEARFRLAQARQARGELGEAARLYRTLIEDRSDPAAREVGEFADRSVIALARTLLADNDPENDREAERLLLGAMSGREVGFPESEQFREALLELGLMYYRAGRHPEAIARLEEALERYPEDPRAVRVRFRLADAMRLSAREASALLQTELTPTRRREVEALRAERLAGAIAIFRRVRDELEATDPRRRSILDEEYLRNAHYFLGACAFDRGDFRAAIEAYDAARERYPRDPASLVAMVQIVSAYMELGEFDRARTANERARLFYQSLPADVWNDPYLPMGRQEWQRWLDSMTALYAGVGV